MNLIFSPALGGSTLQPVCLAYSNTVEICFTATLSSADYAQLQRDGGKVQCWSDLPAPGRTGNDWGEIDFIEGPPASSGASVSLLRGPGADGQIGQRVLYLPISVDFQLASSKTFYYTYRILYASGDVKWLGAYDENGSITLQPDLEDTRLTMKSQGWRREDTGRLIWDTHGATVENVTIARLEQQSDWTIRAAGSDSILDTADSASILFLLPRHKDIVVPSTLALSASPELKLSIDAQGALIATGTGSLLFTCPSSSGNMHGFMESILQYSATNCRILGYSSSCVVLASSMDSSPVSVAVIPLTSRLTNGAVKLDWLSLPPSHLPSLENPIILSSKQPEVQQIYENMGDGLQVLVPPTGSTFVLSVFHPVDGKGEKFQIAIMTPHILKNPQDDVLPTPPPSPKLIPTLPTEPTSIKPTPLPSTHRALIPVPRRPTGGIMAFFKRVVLSLIIFALSLLSRLIAKRKSIQTKPAPKTVNPKGTETVATPQAEVQTVELPAVYAPREQLPGLYLEAANGGVLSCIVRASSETVDGRVRMQVGSKDVVPRTVKTLGRGLVALDLPSVEAGARVRVLPML